MSDIKVGSVNGVFGMIMDTDVYVNIIFVDYPDKTSTEREFMINGKLTKLEGFYQDGSLSAKDVDGKDWKVSTTFFIAKRVGKYYTFPQHQAGFLCAAPLDTKYSKYNFVSNLYNAGHITTESFMIKTNATEYGKYKGWLLAGFNPQESFSDYVHNEYTIYSPVVTANLKIDPKKQSTLTPLKLFNDQVRNVELQDFDDYSNSAHQNKTGYISTGIRGV
jgi:hypothetical protein